ncbi:GmrSD restriction endonuclease domain-containing protein [Burkholderia pseudomallei]|uniref:GmrSD restriction endonuclease domain-containing protein n=1 Tax=Burkholderia pseudomallei TaxID=28450 RepID=UPI0009764C52|nr:DUF262 domain-containing protein [Burkholderia pseudomallei]OMR14524.1 hypothetical protein AQ718_18090 [Burkholderia pseudomallei]
METLTIREILDAVYRGQIRIPAFQRGFVWEPDRVAFLIDSIYKGYPFGALLFWRTSERLQTENKLGPFDLPAPQADFPIDYVLDGQQRVTSIFGVFQTELQGDSPTWKDIYFDFQQIVDVQETQFFALASDEVDPNRHFPLRAIFDTTEYRRLTRSMTDELALQIDRMQTIFREARVPVQTFRTDEKEKVAIIFERINRQGVPLDTLQLLSAWTWSEDFQLKSEFEDLIEELGDYGFTELSNDISLLLRCTAAILTGSSRPESLVQLNGSVVRQRFSEVVNGIRGALDFLATEYDLPSIENLPYENCLIPLSVFFAAPGNSEVAVSDIQRITLSRWFWRAAFSGRYSAGVLRHLDADISEAIKLKQGQPSQLANILVNVTADHFLENRFVIGTVNTKTFIALLAQMVPLNFVSGTPVDLRQKLQSYNRKEFHHLMPKAFLTASGQAQRSENILANFCFIARSDNRVLGGDSPSAYRGKMAANVDDILQSHLCPNALFDDNYEAFVTLRAASLAAKARELCGADD